MRQMINIEWRHDQNRLLGVLDVKRDTTVFIAEHKEIDSVDDGVWAWELSGAFIPDCEEPIRFDTQEEVEAAALKYWFDWQDQVLTANSIS